jgi:hypothetical protein
MEVDPPGTEDRVADAHVLAALLATPGWAPTPAVRVRCVRAIARAYGGGPCNSMAVCVGIRHAWLTALEAEAASATAAALTALDRCRTLCGPDLTVLLPNRCVRGAITIAAAVADGDAGGRAGGRAGRVRDDVICAATIDLRARRLRGNADLPTPDALHYVLFGTHAPAAMATDPPSDWEEWRAGVAEPSALTVQSLHRWLQVRSNRSDARGSAQRMVTDGCVPQHFTEANDRRAVWLTAVAMHVHATENVVAAGLHADTLREVRPPSGGDVCGRSYGDWFGGQVATATARLLSLMDSADGENDLVQVRLQPMEVSGIAAVTADTVAIAYSCWTLWHPRRRDCGWWPWSARQPWPTRWGSVHESRTQRMYSYLAWSGAETGGVHCRIQSASQGGRGQAVSPGPTGALLSSCHSQ